MWTNKYNQMRATQTNTTKWEQHKLFNQPLTVKSTLIVHVDNPCWYSDILINAIEMCPHRDVEAWSAMEQQRRWYVYEYANSSYMVYKPFPGRSLPSSLLHHSELEPLVRITCSFVRSTFTEQVSICHLSPVDQSLLVIRALTFFHNIADTSRFRWNVNTESPNLRITIDASRIR